VNRIILPAALAAALLVGPPVSGSAAQESTSPGIVHTVFMRGHVVHAEAGQVTVCIGKADGAASGQELTVYRVSEHRHGPKGPPTFRRAAVGKVAIDRVIDDHFAEARVVSGEVKVHDIVELQRH
jgi:hypothetical protein